MGTIKKHGNGYQAAVRISGRPSAYKTFPTQREARAWMREKEAAIEAGDVVNPKVRIEDLVDRYVEEIAPKRTLARSHLAHDIPSVRRAFAGMRMSDLQGRGLIDWASKHKTSGSTSLWIIARLRGVLRQAELHWDVKVPWRDMAEAQRRMLDGGMVHLPSERSRRCSDQELERILAKVSGAATTNWPVLLRFCIASAMRIGEVVRITWADLDEADRTILVRDRKHPTKKFGNHQVVPLVNGAFDLLMAQREWQQAKLKKRTRTPARLRKMPERIFPHGPLYISEVFHQAAVAAGVRDIVLHDLRHEGISRLFELGLKIEEVALVSGHTEWRTLARYTHLQPTSVVARERELRQLEKTPGRHHDRAAQGEAVLPSSPAP